MVLFVRTCIWSYHKETISRHIRERERECVCVIDIYIYIYTHTDVCVCKYNVWL